MARMPAHRTGRPLAARVLGLRAKSKKATARARYDFIAATKRSPPGCVGVPGLCDRPYAPWMARLAYMDVLAAGRAHRHGTPTPSRAREKSVAPLRFHHLCVFQERIKRLRACREEARPAVEE